MELKDVIEVLGLEVELKEDATIEEKKEAIKVAAGNKFIDKSLVELEKKNAIAGLGKKVGSAETKMRIVFGDEYRDKNFDELVELLPSVFESKTEALKKELADAKKGSSKEDIAKIQTELDEYRNLVKKLNADLEAEKENAKKLIENKELEFQTKEEAKELSDIFYALNWVDGTKKHTKDGLFMNAIDGKYTFKKVDGVFMVYKEDGATPETGGTTSHLSAVDLFNTVLKKEELLKVNGANGSKEAGGANIDLSKYDNAFVKGNLEKAIANAARYKKA